MTPGQTSVILTDLETPVAARYPFGVFYEELARCLAEIQLVVVGGYGFGDRPVSRALALYLRDDSAPRVRMWSPRPARDQFVERLRLQLMANEGVIVDDQVEVEEVTLPDAKALQRLRAELDE